MDLGEEAFEGGKAAAEGARSEVKVDLGARKRARLGFKDVAGKILFVFDVERDDAALGGDGTAGLDFVALVYLSLAWLRHTNRAGDIHPQSSHTVLIIITSWKCGISTSFI